MLFLTTDPPLPSRHVLLREPPSRPAVSATVLRTPAQTFWPPRDLLLSGSPFPLALATYCVFCKGRKCLWFKDLISMYWETLQGSRDLVPLKSSQLFN